MGDVFYDDLTIYIRRVGDVVYNAKNELFVVYALNPISATNGTVSTVHIQRREYPPKDALSEEERLKKLEDYFLDIESITDPDLIPEDYFLLQMEMFLLADIDKTNGSPAFKQALLNMQDRLEYQLIKVFRNDQNDTGNSRYRKRFKGTIPMTSSGRPIKLASEVRASREKKRREEEEARRIQEEARRMQEEDSRKQIEQRQAQNSR